MNKRYALCVGNNYPGTNAELSGCVNDAWDWSELLGANGYAVDVMLEADKETVIAHLRDLVGRAGFADRIVFTFSGHGTWVPDRDGDEADGRDEAMVMAGLTYADLLLDDELQAIFAELRYGAGALVLSDSCHSGTVSKFSGPQAQVAGKRKFISPIDMDVPLSFERILELEQRTASPSRRTSSLISGCADQEYSYDASFAGRPNGAFTRAAIDAHWSGVSLGRWFSEIRRALPNNLYPQSPQLTASPYRKYAKAL